MKKIAFLLFLVFALQAPVLTAQDKMLTLEDAVYLNPAIYPDRLPQLGWRSHEDEIVYVDHDTLVGLAVPSLQRRTLATIDDLNAGMMDLGLDSVKRFPGLNFVNSARVWFFVKNNLFEYDLVTRDLAQVNTLPEKAGHRDVCEVNRNIAFTVDNNLFIAVAGQIITVTDDDDPGIVNGQSVHRNEFGINKGTFWSPSGNKLAFYRMDETMVSQYPLVDIDARVAEVKNIRYPMAGMKSHEVTLGVYNLETGKKVFMKTGEPAEQYLTAVTWDPTEKYIYIALLNRDQNHLKLNKYDAETGDLVKTLFEEHNDKYVEPEHPLQFFPSLPGSFIWFSRRDGYQHLYWYVTDGELIKPLTTGEWEVSDLLGVTENGRGLWLTGNMESPVEQHIYYLDIRKLKMTRVSQAHGTHTGMISPSGHWVIDSYSSTGVTRQIELRDTKGDMAGTLLTDRDPLKDYALGETSIITIPGENNVPLYARVIKPPHFDPTVKYPVFLYVYGGPHSQLVTDSWLGGSGLFLQLMAQHGYVVFTLDNRGTSKRGLEFEQAIHRNLGTVEVADQMRGVEWLKEQPWVDTTRMGVDGWSYGGFMTLSMMLKNPGVFRAACAGGPVIDWKYYEVMYGERYMDTPDQNPDGYAEANLLNHIDNLQGDILIIHGTMDPVVVWQNSLKFIQECVNKGKQVEYFVYPGHEHNVRGRDRVHLYDKILRFFDEKLKD